MKIETERNCITLIRESGDMALSHESTVTHHIRRLLNAGGSCCWVRCWPDRIGLTACRQGVRNRVDGTIYWHDRYAIEGAHKAFNAGRVFYSRAY